MNVLIIGIPHKSIIEAIKKSGYLEKLYIAAPQSVENIPNIDFLSFEDLINKAKVLKTDIAITFDKDLIKATNVRKIYSSNYKKSKRYNEFRELSKKSMIKSVI